MRFLISFNRTFETVGKGSLNSHKEVMADNDGQLGLVSEVILMVTAFSKNPCIQLSNFFLCEEFVLSSPQR